ncbi:hypothetical protein K1719_019159 [Acacia pycnantha]|nr:hypothetical protein K1719_019159 [Acacia pycnantha]
MNGDESYGTLENQYIRRHHKHEPRENQCTSALVKHIRAPVHLVWSLVRRFDQPQKYKPFVSRCIMKGDLGIGSVREVNVKSGLPATTSTERLEQLDDEEHILSVKIVGGDHRLRNYSSIITVHPEIIDGRPGTMVIESFVVDVPDGNTRDETCYFVEALIRCNLSSLADVSERMAVQGWIDPVNQPGVEIGWIIPSTFSEVLGVGCCQFVFQYQGRLSPTIPICIYLRTADPQLHEHQRMGAGSSPLFSAILPGLSPRCKISLLVGEGPLLVAAAFVALISYSCKV